MTTYDNIMISQQTSSTTTIMPATTTSIPTTRLFITIILETLAFLCSPALFVVSNFVHSELPLWLLGSASVTPIAISLIAAHTATSQYQIALQFIYWAMAWGILANGPKVSSHDESVRQLTHVFSLVDNSLINATLAAFTTIPAILILDAVFFAIISQGNGKLQAYGDAHANIWKGITEVGGAVWVNKQNHSGSDQWHYYMLEWCWHYVWGG